MSLCPSCGAVVLPDRSEEPVEPTLKQDPNFTATDDENDLQMPAGTALQFAAVVDERKTGGR